MSFAFRTGNSWLARSSPVSVRVQKRLVLGYSGTHMVVAGAHWNSVLSSKTRAYLLDELQTLAEFVLNFPLVKRVSWPNL